MHKKVRKWIKATSVGLYVLLAAIFFVSRKWDIALPGLQYWLLLPGLLVIKDLLIFSNILSHSYRITQSSTENGLGRMNQTYFFPILLMMYVLYCIVQHTGLGGRDYSILFLALDEQFLLVLLFLSFCGILLSGSNEHRQSVQKVGNAHAIVSCAVLVLMLIVLWYVVYPIVIQYGILGVVIMNILIVCIFVGVMKVDSIQKLMQ